MDGGSAPLPAIHSEALSAASGGAPEMCKNATACRSFSPQSFAGNKNGFRIYPHRSCFWQWHGGCRSKSMSAQLVGSKEAAPMRSRRKFPCFLIFTALVLFIAEPALAQSAALIDAAKKEGGKVVAYGSLESDTVEAVGKQFRKETGLTMDYWRASATKVMDRVLSEYRVGKPLFDVVLTNNTPMQIIEKNGVFAKYASPSAKYFPDSAIDPKLGPRYRNVIIGIVYNKDIVSPSEAPKSLEDLLKPQYRGKLVMPDPTEHTTTAQWLASLYKLMGKEKAEKYVRDLAATRPILVQSLLPAAERVTTGETPIAISYIKYVYIFGKKGAPLDYVRSGKFLGEGHYVDLSNQAPHPDAGMAFIDFFLGDKSMKIMAEMGEFVNRKGIFPPLPGADKVQFVAMDSFNREQFQALNKEYDKIFVR
jgi:iron(III) transport system substrate-binding protein